MSDFGELDFSKLKLSKNTPQQPDRRQELQSRQIAGQTSPEENAELMGLYAFPDNPRGQELRRKDALGTITEAERKELAKQYQLKDFSPELIDLITRSEASDPNVSLVNMSDGRTITVKPDDTEKVIFTFGLGGCTAMITYGELLDGTRVGIQTHYPPTEMSGNLAKIRELSAQTPIKDSQRRTALIISPGHYVQDPQSGEWSQQVKDKHILDVISVAIQADIGEDTEIRVIPYDENKKAGIKDEGVAVLRIPPKGNNPTYKTQSSAGNI